jgi:hypothetical protein
MYIVDTVELREVTHMATGGKTITIIISKDNGKLL